MSAAVHDQPSEDVEDHVPPLQAYRDRTSTVVRVCVKLHESEDERRRLEDVNVQLLLKLEDMTMSTTAASECCRVAPGNEKSLFAELEMLTQSLAVDSFSNQSARPVSVGTQVDSCETNVVLC